MKRRKPINTRPARPTTPSAPTKIAIRVSNFFLNSFLQQFLNLPFRSNNFLTFCIAIVLYETVLFVPLGLTEACWHNLWPLLKFEKVLFPKSDRCLHHCRRTKFFSLHFLTQGICKRCFVRGLNGLMQTKPDPAANWPPSSL